MEKLATASWRGIEPARSGLWIVVDIIDDLSERYDDEALLLALASVRGRVINLLGDLRRLERLKLS